MNKGTKSFSFAALFFDRERRQAARELYAWCRFCDDAIDEAPSRAEALRRLADLRRLTIEALDGTSVHPAFKGLARICREYSIPSLYPLQLLEGMRMDAEGIAIETENDLRLYCYRVASVVGLMMVHVMGVASDLALRHAADTGLAMQMTNIARDVRDDFQLGRVYLPTTWLGESSQDFKACEFVEPTRRLLNEADHLYASGREGLRYLPLRAALAVASAQMIYRDIGRIVLARGEHAWDQRAVVSLPRKVWLAIGAILIVLMARGFRSWRRRPVNAVLGPEQI